MQQTMCVSLAVWLCAVSACLYSQALNGDDEASRAFRETVDRTVNSRLFSIQRDHSEIIGTQRVILDQMQMVLEIRKQVIRNTEKLDALAEDVAHHEASQSKDPAALAVLETKVDGIAKVAGWLLGLLLTAIGSGVLWAWKQFRAATTITIALRKTEERVVQRHDQIIQKLDHVPCAEAPKGPIT